MESAAASVIQSQFGTFRSTNSISRSGILTAKGSDFVRFGTNFRFSTKVVTLLNIYTYNYFYFSDFLMEVLYILFCSFGDLEF